MKNISNKVNLSVGTDGMFANIVNGMFATTIVSVSKYDWNYTWDFLSNNRKIEFTLDVCKEIEDKVKNK